MSELQTYIKNYFPIPEEQRGVLARYFQKRQLNKNDFFLKAGQYCNELSFIQSGHLRIFDTISGKEITQWISTKGDFVTDLSSLIFGNPGRRSIQAISDVELYSIFREDYEKLDGLIPQWDKIEKKFIAKCFITLEDRVFSFLSMDSAERYQQLFMYKPELFNEVPLHYLASMLGMTPETLSRIRSNS